MSRLCWLVLGGLLVISPLIGCGGREETTVIERPALSAEEQAAAEAAYEESMK